MLIYMANLLFLIQLEYYENITDTPLICNDLCTMSYKKVIYIY